MDPFDALESTRRGDVELRSRGVEPHDEPARGDRGQPLGEIADAAPQVEHTIRFLDRKGLEERVVVVAVMSVIRRVEPALPKVLVRHPRDLRRTAWVLGIVRSSETF